MFFAPRQKKSEEQTKVVDSADLSAAVEICESPEKKFELTPEEQAIINSQLRSVDRLENPNEGDPIHQSIVEGNALFMTYNAAVIQSCFASNNSFLHRLLDGTTEKCISGIQFQRSDLMRMLSHSSFLRDNTIEMYSKVLTSLKCTPKKVLFVPVPWFTCLSNPDFSKKNCTHP